MLKRISTILLAVITMMLVIIVVCWPGMHHGVQLDCPDARATAVLSVPSSFSCFSIHLEGIDIFSRTILSAGTIFLLASIFFISIVCFRDSLPHFFSTYYCIGNFPPFIQRKQYRWFSKHYSLCP